MRLMPHETSLLVGLCVLASTAAAAVPLTDVPGGKASGSIGATTLPLTIPKTAPTPPASVDGAAFGPAFGVAPAETPPAAEPQAGTDGVAGPPRRSVDSTAHQYAELATDAALPVLASPSNLDRPVAHSWGAADVVEEDDEQTLRLFAMLCSVLVLSVVLGSIWTIRSFRKTPQRAAG